MSKHLVLFLTIVSALLCGACGGGGGGGSGGEDSGGMSWNIDSFTPVDSLPGDDTELAGDTAGGPGEDSSCEPVCEGKKCGNDGCGGSCGDCKETEYCNVNGICQAKDVIDPCKGKECGPDDAGGSCGTCGAGSYCDAAGLCKANDPTGTTCRVINRCVNDCPDANYTDCATACINAGSETAQKLYNAFVDCYFAYGSGCATAECQTTVIADKCASQYDTCMQPTATCSDYWDCSHACTSGDSGCKADCWEVTSARGMADYNVYVDCIIDTCGASPPSTCVDSAKTGACKGSFDACFSSK